MYCEVVETIVLKTVRVGRDWSAKGAGPNDGHIKADRRGRRAEPSNASSRSGRGPQLRMMDRVGNIYQKIYDLSIDDQRERRKRRESIEKEKIERDGVEWREMKERNKTVIRLSVIE